MVWNSKQHLDIPQRFWQTPSKVGRSTGGFTFRFLLYPVPAFIEAPSLFTSEAADGKDFSSFSLSFFPFVSFLETQSKGQQEREVEEN